MSYELKVEQYSFSVAGEAPMPAQLGGQLTPDFAQVSIKAGRLDVVTVTGEVDGVVKRWGTARFGEGNIHTAPEWLRLIIESELGVVIPEAADS